MKKALITLAHGHKCYEPWNTYLRPSWESWCHAHHYDLIVFTELFDVSPLAKGRSITWQKLLAMSSPSLAQYDTVIWVDADVLITPLAPDPATSYKYSTVSMSIDDGSPFAEQPLWFKQQWSHMLKHSLRLHNEVSTSTLFSYYHFWGIEPSSIPLFNNGVTIFNPTNHSCIFERIYYQWADGGPGSLDEMIPLNLHLLHTNSVSRLDARFNRLFGVYHAVWHDQPDLFRSWISPDLTNFSSLCNYLYRHSYFLHFAGCHNLMLSFFQHVSTPYHHN